jgi:hypothetical protein
MSAQPRDLSPAEEEPPRPSVRHLPRSDWLPSSNPRGLSGEQLDELDTVIPTAPLGYGVGWRRPDHEARLRNAGLASEATK